MKSNISSYQRNFDSIDSRQRVQRQVDRVIQERARLTGQRARDEYLRRSTFSR